MDARETLTKRLLANREIADDGCWLWTKSKHGHMGYGQTSMPRLRPYRNLLVHRVAAWLWLDFDIDSKKCVLHRCDTPACFNPDHLFIGTVADNQRDMAMKGRSRNRPVRGEAHYRTRLTDADIRAIRSVQYKHGIYTELARQYGLSPQHVRAICVGRLWAHVT